MRDQLDADLLNVWFVLEGVLTDICYNSVIYIYVITIIVMNRAGVS